MLKLKSVNFEQQEFQDHHLEPDYPGQLEWLIGRKTTCDLVLSCPEVSRVHGRIIYTDQTYHFIDVGSTSGSLLNGEIVPHNDKRPLCSGDLLQLGKTFLYVQDLKPPVPVSSSYSDTLAAPPAAQWTATDLLCRCCRIVDETPDVKTFYFMPESPQLFNYLPGQFITLELTIGGERVVRPYSMSSSPTRPHHLSITVKRVTSPPNQPDRPAGLVSNWLHDELKVGDRVKLIGGPLGQFTCLPNLPPKLLLLSAGSGITPMMSMARWVQDTLADCDIVFFHSARTLEDIVFRAELSTLAAQMPNFRLAVTVTQKPTHHPWMGLTGRISDSMLNLVAPDLHDRTVYTCGPAGFMQHIKSMLTGLDFPMQNYYEESFGDNPRPQTPTLPTPPSQAQPVSPVITNQANHVITFVRSQQTISADGSHSILELAEQAGVPIPSACRMGACGACKVLTHNGQVHYDTPPMALTEADRQAGCALACVGYPIDDLQVEA